MSEEVETEEAEVEETVSAPVGDLGKKAIREERKKVSQISAVLAQAGVEWDWESDGTIKVKNMPKNDSKAESNDDLRRSIREEVEREYAPSVLKSLSTAQLVAAGLNTNIMSAEKAANLLDLSDVTLKGGKVDKKALADAIDVLKEDTPRLFKGNRSATDEPEEEDEPRSARGQVGSADIGRKSAPTKPKSAAEILAEKRFGKKR